jgi:hypothetical protein
MSPPSPLGCSLQNTFNARTFGIFSSCAHASIWKTNPTEDRLNIQCLFDLKSKSIQGFFTKMLPQMKFVWRSEFVKCPGSAKELMTETIVIEKPVQIGSEDPRIVAYATIIVAIRRLRACRENREVGRPSLISRLSNVNLVSGNPAVRNRLAK